MKATAPKVSRDYIKSEEDFFRNLLKSYNDIYFITGYGNVGDFLIYEGTRALLNKLKVKYKEIHISAAKVHKGELALVCGGGAWCKAFHDYMPSHLSIIESNFKNVIVLPSSYEISDPSVHDALSKSKALFLARENESYNQIKGICNARLSHDHAFHFDYSKYVKSGGGILNSFRNDNEANSPSRNSPDNNDISGLNITLKEWLSVISSHKIINTDRAHVMIAGAMMGKEVHYKKTLYHKVPAMAEFSLVGLPVSKSND